MSLEDWLKNSWLRLHHTSYDEIRNLILIVERDIQDAKLKEVSADWRFGIAYNAALKLCTILLYSEGYRPEKNLAHFRSIQALPLILGNKRKNDANYLDSCRTKRNKVEYDYSGGATDMEADELIEFVEELFIEVKEWLNENHPELI